MLVQMRPWSYWQSPEWFPYCLPVCIVHLRSDNMAPLWRRAKPNASSENKLTGRKTIGRSCWIKLSDNWRALASKGDQTDCFQKVWGPSAPGRPPAQQRNKMYPSNINHGVIIMATVGMETKWLASHPLLATILRGSIYHGTWLFKRKEVVPAHLFWGPSEDPKIPVMFICTYYVHTMYIYIAIYLYIYI